MSNLKLFFTYYGGKWRVAPKYPPPRYDTIIEPFAGSAGYALRYSDRKVILIEKSPKMAGVWDYLINVAPAEVRALPVGIDHVDKVPGPIEARYLIGLWFNKGASQPRKSPSKWLRNWSYPKSKWGPEIRELVASQVEKIRHWRIICGDYTEAPEIEATWFIDPPYVKSGQHYPFRISDYAALGAWCRGRQGQVMVCEQDGADWLPFKPHLIAKGLEGKRGGKRSIEVLWENTHDQAD